MAITFEKEKNIFHLRTPGTSYLFSIECGKVLQHIYYGAAIDDISGIEQLKAPGMGAGCEAMDADITPRSTDTMPQEYTFYGSSDLRTPAFHAVYEDGSTVTKAYYKSHKITNGKSGIPGLPSTYVENDSEAQTLEIELYDELKKLTIILKYSVYEEIDAICRSVSVINEGAPVNIKSVLSCSVDLCGENYDFVSLYGSWARERYIDRQPLIQGMQRVDSKRGSSSHYHSPFAAICSRDANEEYGDVYGFSFVYSGNFEVFAEVAPTHDTRICMGINSFNFNWLLGTGECFDAPEVVMVYSDKGFTAMSQTYHKLYRTRLCRGEYRDAPRPVLINNWEGTYFDFNEEKILNIARVAKSAGMELMVLDDGWFGKRNSDNCSLGDWYVNEEKLPNGICGLAEKIDAMGMKFGLWFEPEMVSPDSDLYRAHPDWCLHTAGRGRSLGRNQLILDLSREDVCDFIIETMSKHLTESKISYIKWDMNRNFSEAGSALLPPERQQEVAHRYMLGLYHVLSTLTNKFPHVLFEGCSAGGGRFDAGMLPYFTQVWTSDCSDAIERLSIQHGTSLVMPASTIGAHVSAVPNHQVGRITTLETRGNVCMGGQLGYELDLTKLSNDEIEEIRLQIETYKSLRDVVHKGDMYRLTSPFEGNNACWEYVSPNKETAVVIYSTKMFDFRKKSFRLRLKGLDENARYQARGGNFVGSGKVLMNVGIVVGDDKEFASKLMVFDRI